MNKHSTLAEDGQSIYEKQLRRMLEPKHFGEFVAIEPSSGRYFLGETATAALVAASRAMPKSRFFLTRVGRDFAHKIISAKCPTTLKHRGDRKERGQAHLPDPELTTIERNA